MGATLTTELQRLEQQAVADLFFAAGNLSSVATAIEDSSAHLSIGVTHSARELRARATRAHSDLVGLTAAHSPVDAELRQVLVLMELGQHCHLLSNQFELISEQLAAIPADVVDHSGIAERLAAMAGLAGVLLRKATDSFRMRDLPMARALDRDDDVVDAVNREICELVAGFDGDAEERELAFRHVLIARSLERIGDNAVDIGEQTEFLITARRTEFSDASEPRPRTLSR